MLQVRKNEISLCNSSGGPEYLRILDGIFLTMQCQWTFTIRFILSKLQRKCPVYGNNHKKRFGGSNSQVYLYYDNLHSTLSVDFQRRAFLSK